MLLSRLAVLVGMCGIAMIAETSKPAKPVERTNVANTAAQRWLKGMSLHDEIAQLIIMPCFGEAINTRSRVFRQYQHLVRDVHVGGLIVLGHSLHGSIH